MSAAAPPKLLRSPADIEELADRLSAADRIAVDTEFHAERRYRPLLCLVQLAVDPDTAFLVDALGTDLTPLGPAFSRAELLVHGGQRDLELLARATGATPSRVLDTQRLAAFCGHGFPTRLDVLMVDVLGQAPPPAATLENWKRRPLGPDALTYAASDALVLWPLMARLEEILDEAGRLDLARAASAELLEDLDPPARSLQAWRRWNVAPGLSAPERAVAAALMAWRDRKGRERDQPPWYLLGDSLVLNLARTRPADHAALASDRRVGKGMRKRMGDELLETIATAEAGPPPTAIPADAPARRALFEAWAAATAESLGVAPALLLPPDLLQRVVETGPEALAGWRAELAAEPLAALWEGRAALTSDRGSPVLAPPGQ